jgi:triosephosphate isomerase
MRNRYLIANWKMNLPPEGISAYLGAVAAAKANDVTIVVAPPFPFLRDVTGAHARIEAGAQNCADQKSGAFTGEVSPWMLADLAVRYVIIGHSERRAIYGETDAILHRKLAAAIEAGVTPVLCVGEDLRVREAGHVARHLAEQIRAVVTPALDAAREVVIAYEPIWAIGTGRNASVSGPREIAMRRRFSTAAASRPTTSPTSKRTAASTAISSAARVFHRRSSSRFSRRWARLDITTRSGKNSPPQPVSCHRIGESMTVLLVVLHVIISVFLILVVLVQQGKGADLAGAFGGGGSQTAFGARGATTLLHKLTTGFFIAFVLTSLSLAIMQARPRSSVMSGHPSAAPTAPKK